MLSRIWRAVFCVFICFVTGIWFVWRFGHLDRSSIGPSSGSTDMGEIVFVCCIGMVFVTGVGGLCVHSSCFLIAGGWLVLCFFPSYSFSSLLLLRYSLGWGIKRGFNLVVSKRA